MKQNEYQFEYNKEGKLIFVGGKCKKKEIKEHFQEIIKIL